MGVGKSKAKVYDEERPSTHFADIAGYEGSKAEVMEVVDFLQHPEAVRAGRGGRPEGRPHGRAARDRKDPAGQSRRRRGRCPVLRPQRLQLRRDVRRRRRLPGPGPVRRGAQACHRRSSSSTRSTPSAAGAVPAGSASNDEREQTLNQLLSDMDGFEPGANVVVMAATNRAEILDRGAAAAGALRPHGGDPAPQPRRTNGDPRHPRQGQDARFRRRP